MEGGAEALAAVETSSQAFVVERHGLLRRVDTTVLAGHVVGLVVVIKGMDSGPFTIVGVAHSMNHELVVRNRDGRCQLWNADALRTALSKAACKTFDVEFEVLNLRHALAIPEFSYGEAQPDLPALSGRCGNSPIHRELLRVRKRDWLSRRAGRLWGDEGGDALNRAYECVRRFANSQLDTRLAPSLSEWRLPACIPMILNA